MINLKIKYCIALIIICFSWAHFASASSEIVINEFVSHPNQGDQEWVELLNTTGTPIDLTGWKLTELSSPNTTPKENDLILLSGTIDKILIFEVGTSKLNDGGDSVGLYKDSNLVDRVTYGTDSTVKNYSINLVAPSIGKSGALISSNWIADQDPTKNLSNPISGSESVIENNIEEENTTKSVTSTSSSSSKNKQEVLKITTKIISPKIVTAGIPFSFNSLTTTNTGNTYAIGRFVWNFGDGKVSEVAGSTPFDYMYDYAGDYSVNLSYFSNSFSKTPDATDKITIKVIPSDIYINSVGDISDPFIELENKSNYEILLSNWVITGGTHYFTIPEGTTLLPNKKIKLSPKITGFTGEDIKSIIISNSNKETIATYPVVEAQKLTDKNTSTYAIAQNNVSPSVKKNVVQNDLLLKNPQVINLNDLGASAEGAGTGVSKSFYSIVGLILIIGLGLASFLIIKKRGKTPDYIEKEIRAEDMTIVE